MGKELTEGMAEVASLDEFRRCKNATESSQTPGPIDFGYMYEEPDVRTEPLNTRRQPLTGRARPCLELIKTAAAE